MKIKVSQSLSYFVLIAIAATTLYPVFSLFITSVKSGTQVMRDPLGLPTDIHLQNFVDAWVKCRFSSYFLNSVIVTAGTVILTLVLSSLATYPLAKIDFRGKRMLFYLFLIALMLPVHAQIIPLFHIAKTFGVIDSLLGLVIIYLGTEVPFGIFLLRAYVLGVPDELLDAARIDGCSEFSIYWRIVLPLTKPALMTLGIIVFLHIWNDYLFPLFLLYTESNRTLPLGLVHVSTKWGPVGSTYALTTAAAIITSLPVIILYVALNKQFVKGITAGAFKG